MMVYTGSEIAVTVVVDVLGAIGSIIDPGKEDPCECRRLILSQVYYLRDLRDPD